MDENQIRDAVRRVLSRVASEAPSRAASAASLSDGGVSRIATVGVSNRHLHLSEAHVRELFGRGHKLTKMKDLLQPGQIACKETVTLVGPKGSIQKVRVLGPARKETQIEISVTDTFVLGVDAPLRMSGDTKGSASLKIRGTRGMVELQEGVIIARRHLHIAPDEAARFNLKSGDVVCVRVKGIRPVVFEDVAVRAGTEHTLEFHIDIDEANAAGVKNGDLAEIIGG